MNPRHRAFPAILLAWACLSASLLPGSVHGAPTPTAPYKRTIVIGGGSPAQNGTALLAAANSITTTNANNRWLIHLEPGEFALGPATLNLRNFVDLEGSGRGLTTVSSTSTVNVALFLSQASEVRDLTIQGRAIVNTVGGVMVLSSSARLTRVDVDVEGPAAIGILVSNAAPRLDDVSVVVRGTAANASGFHFQDAAVVGRRLSARVEAATQADGLVIGATGTPAKVRLEGLFLRVSAPTFTSGISVFNSDVHVDHADIEVTSSFGFGTSAQGLLTLEDSRVLIVSANGTSINASGGTTRVLRSLVRGTFAAIVGGTGVVLFESSRLEGQNSGARCVGAYDGAFDALDANCN